MTIAQVLTAYNGYHEREAERLKSLQIVTWESIRWQTWILWNLHVTKKSRMIDPQKLLKFDWDKKPEAPKKEDWDRINNLFPDRLRNGNQ